MKPYVYKNEENEPLKLVYLLLHFSANKGWT